MKKFRRIVASVCILIATLTLTGCSMVTVDDIKKADTRFMLVEKGLLGDKWIVENDLGRRDLIPCGVPVFERCFKVPGTKQILRYPVLVGSAESDAKLSGLFWGQEFHCRKPTGLMQPELICAVI